MIKISNVIVDKTKIDLLANSIAAKSGESLTLTLDEMVEAVDGINVGITPTGNINITQAGQTDVTNYATATVAAGTAGIPTASKGTVSNHSITITPSVTNTTGYIEGSSKIGIAVTVSASELVSGTYTVNSSGTKDVTNYASISVPGGTATTPATTITATPSISINSSGLITATNSKTQSVSPTVSAGYISSGTSGTITVNGSNTSQLTTQAATTITPTESSQQAVASGVYTTGAITVGAISSSYVGSGITRRDETDLSASGATVTVPAGYYAEIETKSVAAGTVNSPVATKGTVSNNQISITPSVVVSSGYVAGDTLTGTAVTVSASELVSGTKTITENGNNIDVTNYASVNVNIPNSITIEETADPGGGTILTITGEQISPSDVSDQIFFIDYDGTILYSYTAQEANALTALPTNPSHSGLTAQGWNWSLAQIKAQLTAMPDAPVWVGQMYVTQSGDTEIDVSMPDGRLSPTLTIAVNGTVTVDWGDGTTASTVTGSSLTTRQAPSHTYATSGDYTIVIHVVSGNIAFYGTSSYLLLRKNTTENQNKVYANCIRSVRLGSGITSIGDYMFCYCYSLASVTIPSNITSIGTYTFSNCSSLASVTIPSSVTSIGTYSFNYCSTLESVAIPSGVTSIGNYAFRGCSGLTSVIIPSSVTSIGESAFYNCSALESVAIPSEVTSIGNNAFYWCYGLTSVAIPSGVTSIGEYAFYNCTGLQSVTISSTVTSIGQGAFYACYGLKSVTIPSMLASISSSVFSNCVSLTSLTIPSTVTSIGQNAFYSCYGAVEYHILPTTVPTLGNTVFQNIPFDCVIYVPYSSDHSILNAYKTATNWSAYASYIVEESQ